jgi:hypothetical protein
MELLLLVAAGLVALVVALGVTFAAGSAVGLLYGRWYWDGSESNGRASREWPALRRVARRALRCGGCCYHIEWEPGALDALRALPPDMFVLYAGGPHGVLAASAAFAFALGDEHLARARLRDAGLPLLGVHRLLTTVPLVRDLALALGAVDASRASLKAVLACGRRDLALVPGGVRDMVPGNSTRSGNRGYIKLAWEHRLAIVPVVFEDEAALCAVLPLPAWLQRVREWFIALPLLRYPLPLVFFPRLWRLPLRITFRAPVVPRQEEETYDDFEQRVLN